MHHMGIALDGHILFHLYRSKLTDFAQIIPAKIHQHVVLGTLFFIPEKLLLQLPVFGARLASGAGSGQREGIQGPVLEFCQCFGRCAGYFDVVTGKVEHIGGGVGGAEHPVYIEETALSLRLHGVGENHLKNIAFLDVVPGLFHHVHKALFGKAKLQRRGKMQGAEYRLCAGGQ